MEPQHGNVCDASPALSERRDIRDVERQVALVASHQHGVLTWPQLLGCGVSPSTISRWSARGRLHRVHQSVYAVGHVALSREGRWMAAVLAAGDGAALGSLAGASLWRISRFETDRTTVISPRRRRGLREIDLRFAAGLTSEDMTARDSIPVLRVPQLLVDLGRDLTPWQLANVVHEAAYKRLLDRPRIDELLDRRRHVRGMGVLRQALAFHEAGSAGTMSPLEDEFLRLVQCAGFPLPDVNVFMHTSGGTFRVDFVWRRRRLCVETDGRGHRRPANEIDDSMRDQHLVAAGYRVERFTGRAVWGDPFSVVRRLEHLLK